jgi:integrase/recombinase XerD
MKLLASVAMSKNEHLRVCVHQDTHQLVGDIQGPIKEVNHFLEAQKSRGLSPQTIRAYAYDLLTLYRWMNEKKYSLIDLTQMTLLDFLSAQRDVKAHPKSINRRLVTCRLLYRFCMSKEIATGVGASFPASYYKGPGRDRELGIHTIKKHRVRVLRVKTPRKIVEPLTAEQVLHFLNSFRRYRDLAILYLMLLCGLRSREVLNIKLTDISFDEHRIRVQGKGNKERALPLPEIVMQSVTEYLSWERPSLIKGDALFVVLQGKRRGQSMTPDGLRSLFRWRRSDKTIAQANPHRFRHTFGADMARSGVRLPILQKMMGHSNFEMTLQYINLSMIDIADEYHRAIKQIEKRYSNQ